jgi:UrcA family protein
MNNLIKIRSKLAKIIGAAGFLAIGAAAMGGTALASEAASAAKVTYPVGFSDLDISTAGGAKTLYLRIRYAAETVCESAVTYGKKEGEACVNKAVNEAVARINAPGLTQYIQSKGDKAGLVQLAKTN